MNTQTTQFKPVANYTQSDQVEKRYVVHIKDKSLIRQSRIIYDIRMYD